MGYCLPLFLLLLQKGYGNRAYGVIIVPVRNGESGLKNGLM